VSQNTDTEQMTRAYHALRMACMEADDSGRLYVAEHTDTRHTKVLRAWRGTELVMEVADVDLADKKSSVASEAYWMVDRSLWIAMRGWGFEMEMK